MLEDDAANPGSGLGIYISKELLKILGGSPIRVVSDRGLGTFFNFDIPIA